MHGQGYRGNNTDPTHPSYLSFLPQGAAAGYTRGAAIGRTETEPQFQRPFPPFSQNGVSQHSAGPGYASNVPKVRAVIAALPRPEASTGGYMPLSDAIALHVQTYSKLRLWYNDS